MNLLFKTLTFLASVSFFISCDSKNFGVGSNVYAERIEIACSTPILIKQLAELKSAPQYQGDINEVPVDGPSRENKNWHFFTFVSHEYKMALRFYVEPITSSSSSIVIVSIKDLNDNSKWQVINHGADKKKQAKMLEWLKFHVISKINY